jgi:hypothetical protein
MEYWEFLIQKEGDRSWQPVKSPSLQIEEGRYRVVAHSSLTNTDVEICLTHDSTEEVPPKRRSQKRSRRTNPEGLMVVIPFTYLRPGRWELRCCGDIMSEFLGNSWQEVVQLQVLSKATKVLQAPSGGSPVGEASQTEVQPGLNNDLASSSDRDLAVDSTPPRSFSEASPRLDGDSLVRRQRKNRRAAGAGVAGGDSSPASSDPSAFVEPGSTETEAAPLTPRRDASEIAEPKTQVQSGTNSDEARPVPEIFADTLHPLESSELYEQQEVFTGDSADVDLPTNPILDESLQMLEQILQQVLEPVLQELERSEPPDQQPSTEQEQIPVTPESEIPIEWQGLILTLNEEALVARRGESLTIAGQVDVLDVNQLSGSETSSTLNCVFQGTLRYELRDPQTSQVLLDVQQPLPEQALPLAFSHSLEIPSDCNTRLILGKVTLYGSTPTALASQPFTVTADLDELLGAIIPGSKVMPVAKMLVLANNLAAFQENQEEPSEPPPPPMNQALLDLINTSQSRQSLPLQPAPQQPLPPQIYKPAPNHTKSKSSLQLPKLPKVQPVASTESSAAVSASNPVEVKQEDIVEQAQPVTLADELSAQTPHALPADTAEDTTLEQQLQELVRQLEEATSEEDTVPPPDSASTALDATQFSDSSALVADSPSDTLDAVETPEPSESTADSPLDTSDATNTLEIVTPSADSLWSDWDETEWLDAPEPDMQSTDVPPTEPVVDKPKDVDNAFQALKLQDRFWLRLNSLAADAELSQWLKSDLLPPTNPVDVEEAPPQLNFDTGVADIAEAPPQLNADRVVDVEQLPPQLNSDTGVADVEEVTSPLNLDLLADFDESIWEDTEDFDSETPDTAQLQLPPIPESISPEMEMPEQLPLVDIPNIDWESQEIVVEDEDLPEPEQTVVRDDASDMISPVQQLKPQPKSAILYPRQLNLPLPAPELFIPTSELAAGEPVTVRVKLPPHPARLCVKLWVQDRQSRSLLDGPRWLMDLIPDRSGELEALTQLTVPFGSAEIRFEAIAIDIDSQRESHKVAVDCVVVPPDLPNFSLDEF